MNQEKSKAYKELVEDMQKKYPVYTGQSPKGKVELFAPIVNGENLCQEINLYTYWQGFGYAEKTPRIKYLLVAQDWGNLFRADPQYIQELKSINEHREYVPYSKVPTDNGTNANLFRLFKII